MATNVERQKSLDRVKWKESERAGYDLSGTYPHCENCEYRIDTCYAIGCKATQKERETKSLCAKSYNHMIYLANKK